MSDDEQDENDDDVDDPTPRTYDDIIASGIWTGEQLVLRSRMANYVVDGKRLGSIPWPSKSGSIDDSTVDKASREILSAALTFAHLGYERVDLRAHDAEGKELERPDLDATIDGQEIGVEVADVPGTPQHDAMKDRIERAIRKILREDASFRSAFGNHYFEINLNPVGALQQKPLKGNKEADAIVLEIEKFIRCGLVVGDPALLHRFPAEYMALARRRCEFHLSQLDSGRYFGVSDGPMFGPDETEHRYQSVIEVLDKHRGSATRGYRALPEIWMVLFLPDADEFFRRTAHFVAQKHPPIAPFKRCFVTDTAGTVTEIVEA